MLIVGLNTLLAGLDLSSFSANAYSVMFTGHVSLENEQWCLLKCPDYAANSLSLKIEAWRSTDSTWQRPQSLLSTPCPSLCTLLSSLHVFLLLLSVLHIFVIALFQGPEFYSNCSVLWSGDFPWWSAMSIWSGIIVLNLHFWMKPIPQGKPRSSCFKSVLIMFNRKFSWTLLNFAEIEWSL